MTWDIIPEAISCKNRFLFLRAPEFLLLLTGYVDFVGLVQRFRFAIGSFYAGFKRFPCFLLTKKDSPEDFRDFILYRKKT